MKVARERDTTVITISDVEELGVEKAVEIALECAWKDADAVFLSFDIDSIDAGFVPGHRLARAGRAAAARGAARRCGWSPARASAGWRWSRSRRPTTSRT